MGPKRVMHIEDNEADAELFKLAVAKCPQPPQISHFEDGASALADLRSPDHGLPDLVLLDLRMPGMSGHDVLNAIRSDPVLQRLFVAVLTTSDDPKEIGDAYDERANVYLVKPVALGGFDETAATLATLLARIKLPPAGSA